MLSQCILIMKGQPVAIVPQGHHRQPHTPEILTVVASCPHWLLVRGVGERGAGGGSCPPSFESWGAQPPQFFTSVCAVVIV